MNSKHLKADYNFAWPTAEIAVMGGDGMVNIVYKKELQSADDIESKREELKKEYADAFFTPFRAADLGFIDAIIQPNQTRIRLIEAFSTLENKREGGLPKKHGNIPL